MNTATRQPEFSDVTVNQELADAIERVRTLLHREAGDDFAFQIYRAGQLVAASSAKHGTVFAKGDCQ